MSKAVCYLVESESIRLYFSGCPLERTTMQDVLRLALGSKASRPGLQLREVRALIAPTTRSPYCQ